MDCKCGCGEAVRSGRKYVNKEHQLAHMSAGEARRIGALQPIEAKQEGGRVAGTKAHASGRLAEAARKGGQRSREIAVDYRRSSSAD